MATYFAVGDHAGNDRNLIARVSVAPTQLQTQRRRQPLATISPAAQAFQLQCNAGNCHGWPAQDCGSRECDWYGNFHRKRNVGLPVVLANCPLPHNTFVANRRVSVIEDIVLALPPALKPSCPRISLASACYALASSRFGCVAHLAIALTNIETTQTLTQ